jgi:hypothetical protein
MIGCSDKLNRRPQDGLIRHNGVLLIRQSASQTQLGSLVKYSRAGQKQSFHLQACAMFSRKIERRKYRSFITKNGYVTDDKKEKTKMSIKKTQNSIYSINLNLEIMMVWYYRKF